MTTLEKPTVAIFVEQSLGQWIVRDPEGRFWMLPLAGDSWAQREPFFPTPETILSPVPGHYKDMLGLPY